MVGFVMILSHHLYEPLMILKLNLKTVTLNLYGVLQEAKHIIKADFMCLQLCYSITGKRKPQYSSLVSSWSIVTLQTTASPVWVTIIQYKEVVIW